MAKQVNKSIPLQERRANLPLSIFLMLKQGMNPAKIYPKLDIKRKRMDYYLSSLKQAGFIKKVGYGTWQILKDFDKTRANKSIRVDSINPLTLSKLPKGKIRGHAFQFKVLLKKNIRNWDNETRESILSELDMQFYPLKLVGGGQGLIFKGRKVHLTNNSIIIYEKASYVSSLAQNSKNHAIYDLLALLRALERHLHANLWPNGKISFRVTKQHYAQVKNDLAHQYNRANKKLHIYTPRGLVFLVDDSFNLDEFEAVHSKTGVQDMDNKIIPFFQSLDKHPLTTTFILESLGGLVKTQQMNADNIEKHMKVLDDMSSTLKQIRESLDIFIKENSKKK